MAMFTKLTICLALLTLTSMASGSKCEKRKHQFVSKCLKQGYQPEILENCELSGEAGKRMNKCKRMEKVVIAKCDYECSTGTRWRGDRRCGQSYLLPDGTALECNPDGEYPCCDSMQGRCGNEAYCSCDTCVDFRVVKKIRESGEQCTITEVNGFLKHVCYDEDRYDLYFKCAHSDLQYERYMGQWDNSARYSLLDGVSTVCEDDSHSYQACVDRSYITNSNVLCGGFLCTTSRSETLIHKYIRCDDDCNVETCVSSTSPSFSTRCDDTCDTRYCEDESVCNGYVYGMFCEWWGGSYIPLHGICDGYTQCYNGEDEVGCEDTTHTCTQYRNEITVPILDHTRCGVFDVSQDSFPYCTDYTDQTNCSDPERVGGYCEVNGYYSSISKYMVCYGYDTHTNTPVQLCDDNLEINCGTLSGHCTIHKHKLCDGVNDCPDGSDEIHDMCRLLAADKCARRFNDATELKIPISWIMDGIMDCRNGLDENSEHWDFCGNKRDGTHRVNLRRKPCENVYLCPGDNNTYFEVPCDEVESCGRENKVCQISRNFPEIAKTVPISNNLVKDLCANLAAKGSLDCELKEFYRPPHHIFGVVSTRLMVPKSKVDCDYVFGEYYVYLSCLGLCLNSTCMLENNDLQYDSCPGQYQDRIYTLADNSYLTFVVESENGDYQNNYFRCNNSRCIEYSQVCDLTDDCGDMSDELNCSNHMICEYSQNINEAKYKLISKEQKCDDIFDCVDSSSCRLSA